MKITEIINEARSDGSIPTEMEEKSMGGVIRMRDVGGYDRTYHLNRIMMAAAMADGQNENPVNMDGASFIEKYNVAIPYSDAEELMMYQAMATIPTDGKELVKRGRSEESPDTNKASPIPKRKKNKYGV